MVWPTCCEASRCNVSHQHWWKEIDSNLSQSSHRLQTHWKEAKNWRTHPKKDSWNLWIRSRYQSNEPTGHLSLARSTHQDSLGPLDGLPQPHLLLEPGRIARKRFYWRIKQWPMLSIMHDILSFGLSRPSDRGAVSGYVHRAHVRDQAVNEFNDLKNRIQIIVISLRFFATTKKPLRGIPNSNVRSRSKNANQSSGGLFQHPLCWIADIAGRVLRIEQTRNYHWYVLSMNYIYNQILSPRTTANIVTIIIIASSLEVRGWPHGGRPDGSSPSKKTLILRNSFLDDSD